MRLIDADALLKALGFAEPCSKCDHIDPVRNWRCEDSIWGDVCCAIFDAPAIDAVPVVRCKDCVGFEGDEGEGIEGWCIATGTGAAKDGYCSYGERKAEP